MAIKVRKWVIILHRDVGYFLVGLTCLYAISGVAVNHIDDWNPSYSKTVEAVSIGPLESTDLDGLEREVMAALALDPAEIRGRHRPMPARFKLFLPDGGEVNVLTTTGEGTITRLSTRPLLYEANVLHLNHMKGIWTWVADIFAVLLLMMALTGMFVLRGKTGIKGRGKWFVGAGFALPIVFLVLHYQTL